MGNFRTVFVVGAGAGADLGMPLGDGLKVEIANLLNTVLDRAKEGENISIDERIWDALAIKSTAPSGMSYGAEYLDACSQIVNAMPIAESIDNFLDARKNDDKIIFCGKLAIVDSILKAEAATKISEETMISASLFRPNRAKDSWYSKLVQLLCRNADVDQVADRLSGISFIIFNYDRLIEYFLFEALQVHFPISQEKAAEVVGKATFFHPYGAVAPLPWQDAEFGIHLGQECSPQQLVVLSDQIQTFMERQTDKEAVNAMQNAMASANRLVFQGFAFHDMNTDLIFPAGSSMPQDILATVMNLSSDSLEYLTKKFRHKFSAEDSEKIGFVDGTCSELLDEYGQRIYYGLNS